MPDGNPMEKSRTQIVREVLDDLDRFRSLIEEAIEHGGRTHTFDDIVTMVLTGRVVFWPLVNSFLITEIVDYPQERCYHIFLAGGEIEELIEMHHKVQQAAIEQGCSHLSIAGRKGWVRALKSHGWTPQLIVLKKPIIDTAPTETMQ